MFEATYQYFDTNDAFLILHDCVAERVLWKDGVLSFGFPEGIWVSPLHEANSLEKTVKTDAAKVDFYLTEGKETNVTVHVFSKTRFGKELREEWSLDKLIRLVNAGLCKVEFLSQYKADGEQLIVCWLWLKKKPHLKGYRGIKECHLTIEQSKAVYCWNNLCANRTW